MTFLLVSESDVINLTAISLQVSNLYFFGIIPFSLVSVIFHLAEC